MKTDIENVGQTPATPSIYYQITRDGGKPEGESSMYSTFTGAAVYSNEEKFQKIDYADIADKSATYQGETDNGWVAMIQHHFVSAWVPEQGEKRENYANAVDKNLYSIGTLVKLRRSNPGRRSRTRPSSTLARRRRSASSMIAPGLELVVDYGWLTFLAKPIYWLLSFLHGIVGNWGWAIVLLTCIVKAILYPISAAGYRSMARMKEVTPRMKAIQEKYKGRQAAPQPGDDGALSAREDQPGGRVPADLPADPGVPRPLLGAAGLRSSCAAPVDPLGA